MNMTKKCILTGIAILVACLSIFLLAKVETSVDHHKDTIEYLNEKQKTVMELTAGSTAASAAITLIPGDAGTPIAEKLADFSSYFLIVLCAILLEKYMVTIMGMAAFQFLIPIACMAFIASLWWKNGFKQLAFKLGVFGLMLAAIIPSSVKISKMIETTYADSIQASIANAKDEDASMANEAEALNESEALAGNTSEDGIVDGESEALTSEKKSGFAKAFDTITGYFGNKVEDMKESVSSSATNVLDKAETVMNKFMEALAVMLVTSCLIPILVIVFLVWFCKVVLGVQWGPIPVHNHNKCDMD